MRIIHGLFPCVRRVISRASQVNLLHIRRSTAISGRKTIQEIAADHAIQASQWKRQLLDREQRRFQRNQRPGP
jgi:hypothetical protein